MPDSHPHTFMTQKPSVGPFYFVSSNKISRFLEDSNLSKRRTAVHNIGNLHSRCTHWGSIERVACDSRTKQKKRVASRNIFPVWFPSSQPSPDLYCEATEVPAYAQRHPNQWQAVEAADFCLQCLRRNTEPTRQFSAVTTHVISIREIIGSSLGWGGGCLDIFHSFPQSFQASDETSHVPVVLRYLSVHRS
jgi:hypothetical protein